MLLKTQRFLKQDYVDHHMALYATLEAIFEKSKQKKLISKYYFSSSEETSLRKTFSKLENSDNYGLSDLRHLHTREKDVPRK